MTDEQRQKIDAYIQRDPFARFLGAEVAIVAPGHSRVSLTVTDAMLNFHGFTHGAVIFAIGDIAFAAASNSHGQTSLALNINMNFLKTSTAGDRLIAEAREQSASGPTALYDITIYDAQTQEIVARSQDLVYRKKEWFVAEKP